MILRVSAFALVATLVGCTGGNPSDPGDASLVDASEGGTPCLFCLDASLDASVARKVQLQLDNCNGNEGCHITSAAHLTYPLGDETRLLINVPSSERPELMRVVPGDPLSSYLWLKVNGDGGIEGGRMPLSASFDPRIPALFFEWIEAGAGLP